MLSDRNPPKRIPPQNYSSSSLSSSAATATATAAAPAAAAAPAPSIPKLYSLNLNDNIYEPKQSDGKGIVFEQTIDHGRTGENEVSRLSRVNIDNPEMYYYVITGMNFDSPDPLPKDLYEKINENNTVKKVGSYKGESSSDIKSLTIDTSN